MNPEKSPSPTDLPVLMALDAPPDAIGIGEGSPIHLKKWTEQVDLRLEVMASILTRGISAQRVRRAAKRLGVPVEHVRLWLKNPQVIKKAGMYGTAISLNAQVKKAKEGDTLAFKTLAQLGGALDSGGPKIQVNTQVDARQLGNTDSDKGFFRQFRRRVEERLDAQASD